MKNIRIFYDGVKYRVKEWNGMIGLFERIIKTEGKICGDISFIISNDRTIKDLNISYLKHSWVTDVISFDYNEGKKISGEIYISLDTVKRNAINYKVSLSNELLRIMIHGILHLCGYEDNDEERKMIMSKKEDEWLEEYSRKE